MTEAVALPMPSDQLGPPERLHPFYLLTGLGQAASAGPRMPFRTGHEGATVRMDPSGAVTVLAGVTSQGQGLETTVAQVVAAHLGVEVDAVTVVLGDTDATPFGLGAFASSSL